MKIGVLGGGPAGLYFAYLTKKRDPAHDVVVLEQNPAGATYGWGVVFSDVALSHLKEGDAEVYGEIAGGRQAGRAIHIVHRGETVPVRGNAFLCVPRLELLRVLQRHCRRVGVAMRFETRAGDLRAFADCDLVVGADGANSVLRDRTPGRFGAELETRPNKFVWYGVERPFHPISLIFREYGGGLFIAHAYSYSETMSTFIVECDAASWRDAGLAAMSDAESRAFCELVFAGELAGRPLLSNKSAWANYTVVRNRRWYDGRLVLLGDALRTVHFSVGSGTRMAMQDAIALDRALAAAAGNVEAGLAAFEAARRPVSDSFQELARNSILWYETVRDRVHLDPTAFAYSYMRRTGKVSHEALRRRAPDLVAAYEAAHGAPAVSPARFEEAR